MINVQTIRLTSPGSAWNNVVKSSKTQAKLLCQKCPIRKNKLLCKNAFFSRDSLNIIKLGAWYSKMYCACCSRSWFDWNQTRHSLQRGNFYHKWKSVWWEPCWVGLQLECHYRFSEQHPPSTPSPQSEAMPRHIIAVYGATDDFPPLTEKTVVWVYQHTTVVCCKYASPLKQITEIYASLGFCRTAVSHYIQRERAEEERLVKLFGVVFAF